VDKMSSLPGEDLIRRGLEDLAQGKETLESLLVSIGASRIRQGGIDVPEEWPEANDRLYLLLSELHGNDAHSEYNSLLRRLNAFASALERAR
jgi:hypothetical protein